MNPDYFKDISDAIFMTTRPAEGADHLAVYDRTFPEGFIRPGIGAKNWVSRSNYPALNVVPTGPAEVSIYVNQDYAQPTAHRLEADVTNIICWRLHSCGPAFADRLQANATQRLPHRLLSKGRTFF